MAVTEIYPETHAHIGSRPSALTFDPDLRSWLAERGGNHLQSSDHEPLAASTVPLMVRRLAVLALAILLGAAIWTVGGWMNGSVEPVGADITAEAATVVVVQPGDTLWSIAASLEGTGDGDVRATVDRIAALNGGAQLTVGQRLVVGR